MSKAKIVFGLIALLALAVIVYPMISGEQKAAEFREGYKELNQIGLNHGFDITTLYREEDSDLAGLKKELKEFKAEMTEEKTVEAQALVSLTEVIESKIEFYETYDDAKEKSRKIALSQNICQEIALLKEENSLSEKVIDNFKEVGEKIIEFSEKHSKNLKGVRVSKPVMDLTAIEGYYAEQLNASNELEELCSEQ